jgi:hypothetical protein
MSQSNNYGNNYNNNPYKYFTASRQSVAEEDLNDWRYEDSLPKEYLANMNSQFPFGSPNNNGALANISTGNRSGKGSTVMLDEDPDEFVLKPSYMTVFAVWVSSILDDLIGFACNKPHLSAASGLLLVLSASPFLGLMAATVCTALLVVLFLTCAEGALILVFMFLFASFVISTVVVSMITLFTIYIIHSSLTGIYDHVLQVRRRLSAIAQRYYASLQAQCMGGRRNNKVSSEQQTDQSR